MSSPALRRALSCFLLLPTLAWAQAEPIGIRWDAEFPLARQLRFLPSPPRSAFAAEISSAELSSAAQQALQRHHAQLFGSFTPTLEQTRLRRSLSGSQIFHRQLHRGVPVEGAELVVRLNRAGQALSIDSSIHTQLSLERLLPRISHAGAIELARGDAAATDRVPPRATLVVLPQGGGRLAWRVELSLWAPFVDWLAYVDAENGVLIERHDRMLHEKPVQPGFSLPVLPMQERLKAGAASARKVDGRGLVLPRNPLAGHPERYALRDGDPLIDSFREDLVLSRLDGSGYLRGSYADVNNSDQPRANIPSLEFDFSSLTVNGHFHEVNAYWHVDVFQDYISNTLGVSGANDDMQLVYVHQGEDDNSSYSPGTDYMRFGDGGVDDSADGEIVLHEYGHAIHDAISGLGFTFENSALSEGFGDYCAATFAVDPLVGEWDATSYNPGPPPYLRRTDLPLRYPEDVVIGAIHETGRIISSAWWDLRSALGPVLADRLILESFFLFPNQGGFADFASATQQVDVALYDGAHLVEIYDAYTAHGIPLSDLLALSHQELADDPDVFGPYPVETTVASTRPLASFAPVQLFHRFDGETSWTAEPMTAQGGNRWSSEIDGPGERRRVEYYLRVENDEGTQSFSPTGAPAQYHSFEAGATAAAPTIEHQALRNLALDAWPPRIEARAQHEDGIEFVQVRWSIGPVTQPTLTLTPVGDGVYAARLPSRRLAPGDTIHYEIAVRAKSAGSAEGVDGPHSFEILAPLHVVLEQNRPNPFNPNTHIDFILPQASSVRVIVFDVAGRRVRELANGPFDAGPQSLSWDGRDDAGRSVASGVYIYQLESPYGTRARRMTLLQ